MTDLQLALRRYTERSQFHDASLLDKVIEAVRHEEEKKFLQIVDCGLSLQQIRNALFPTTRATKIVQDFSAALTDTFCPDCGLPQFETPSGLTCQNGHGY